jgi:hypothetical protein
MTAPAFHIEMLLTICNRSGKSLRLAVRYASGFETRRPMHRRWWVAASRGPRPGWCARHRPAGATVDGDCAGARLDGRVRR